MYLQSKEQIRVFLAVAAYYTHKSTQIFSLFPVYHHIILILKCTFGFAFVVWMVSDLFNAYHIQERFHLQETNYDLALPGFHFFLFYGVPLK